MLSDNTETGALHAILSKAGTSDQSYSTNQGFTIGRVPHAFDMTKATQMQDFNEHHAASIHAKVSAITGLGHGKKKRPEIDPITGMEKDSDDDIRDESEADKALDPLCNESWAAVLSDVTEDYVQTANGYIEVVRKRMGGSAKDDPIVGLHHAPSPQVFVFIEDEDANFHYEVVGDSNDTTGQRRFSRFGDHANFLARMSTVKYEHASIQFDMDMIEHNLADGETYSEIIHIRRPTSRSRWYGYPDWLSAVAGIELIAMVVQYNFDFYLNRGVPELMALFLGQQIDEDDWATISNAFLGMVGSGNHHKTIVANLEVNTENFEVVIEKLSKDEASDEDRFAKMRENLALGIVSAHRVPPLLAGIQIPGKLGATNELPNALAAFQLLYVAQQQRIMERALGNTLGNQKCNGGLTTRAKHFKLRTITDEIDLGSMDTVSRMRTPQAQASAEGRDPKDGLKD
jgi:hypothetical protein